MAVCMHLLLRYAAGSRQRLCKAGVLVRHIIGYNVQVAHRQRQILCHSALHNSRLIHYFPLQLTWETFAQ